MALQLGALRDALESAGAAPDKAAKAAEELAGYDRELSEVRSDLKLLTRMNALNLALSIAILLRLFIH